MCVWGDNSGDDGDYEHDICGSNILVVVMMVVMMVVWRRVSVEKKANRFRL